MASGFSNMYLTGKQHSILSWIGHKLKRLIPLLLIIFAVYYMASSRYHSRTTVNRLQAGPSKFNPRPSVQQQQPETDNTQFDSSASSPSSSSSSSSQQPNVKVEEAPKRYWTDLKQTVPKSRYKSSAAIAAETAAAQAKQRLGTGKGYPDPEGMKQIKSMMKHAWDRYVEHSWGMDDLKPISKTGMNWLGANGLAATLVDSLDTLWIMGMHDEYRKARDYVQTKLRFDLVSHARTITFIKSSCL